MPEHIAVQCFQCNVFQVVQRCKPTGAQRVSKWECRMCRAKQTVLRVFGQGMQAAPLRPLVQELNMNRGRAADVAAAAPAREPEPAPQPVFVRFDEEWDALLSGSSSQDEDGDDNDGERCARVLSVDLRSDGVALRSAVAAPDTRPRRSAPHTPREATRCGPLCNRFHCNYIRFGIQFIGSGASAGRRCVCSKACPC